MKTGGRFRNCRECDQSFEVKRDWQIFCSPKCRLRFNQRYNEICYYCGVYGNHRDHVNPKSFSGKFHFEGIEYVFACHECNVNLGSKLLELPDRFDFLINTYVRKYGLQKSVVEWDTSELDELGAELRKRIKHLLAVRRRAEERVIYLRHMKNEITKHA